MSLGFKSLKRICLYCTSGSSRPIIGWTLPL